MKKKKYKDEFHIKNNMKNFNKFNTEIHFDDKE